LTIQSGRFGASFASAIMTLLQNCKSIAPRARSANAADRVASGEKPKPVVETFVFEKPKFVSLTMSGRDH